MHFRPFILTLMLLTAFSGLVGGCAVIDLPDKLDLDESKAKPERPVKMTAMWTDTVLVEAGVVGFGGRIMFYGKGEEDPIQVEGELSVFAYDDTNDVGENPMPARKYVFRAEDLKGHYSKSKLGHSYSFWIPWDRVGGPRKQVSLIARFKSAQGGVVMSEMTKHLLPGTAPSAAPGSPGATPVLAQLPGGAAAIPSAATTQVTQATHTYPVASAAPLTGPANAMPTAAQPLETAPAPAPVAGMQTTTITLSEAMGAAARNQAQQLATPESRMPERLPTELAPNAATNMPQQAVPAGALRTPATTPLPPVVTTAAPSANSLDPESIRALVREAVQESLAASQEEQPVDRFGRRKYRARIAPKLPPTRDPAPSPQRPAAPQSVPPTTHQTALPNGSTIETSVSQGSIQRPSSWAR
jgi:hypothetical protein